MGHEYIEIKNVHAAIACYRRAAGNAFISDNFLKYDL